MIRKSRMMSVLVVDSTVAIAECGGVRGIERLEEKFIIRFEF